MWVLQNDESEAERLIFRLSPGATRTIGRITGVDFIVDAPLVSRVHCRLEAADEGIDITDLESTNGTYLNDERIARGRGTDGDRLRVGRIELRLSRL